MDKKYLITGLIVAVGTVSAIAFAVTNRDQDSPTKTALESRAMEDKKSTEVMTKDETDVMVANGENMEKDGTVLEASTSRGTYLDYSEENIKSAQAAGNKVVLFFHAKWCPFCKEADAAFNARLDDIPKGVSVLKTDYDTETKLKEKYGITYQHTFVQINNQGEQVARWAGGDIDNLTKYVK